MLSLNSILKDRQRFARTMIFASLMLAVGAPAQAAKNVILMVSDGAGIAPHQGAELWTGSPEPYNNSNFMKTYTSTYALRDNAGALDNNIQDPNRVYDPVKY
jgi:alkaline phosphatase